MSRDQSQASIVLSILYSMFMIGLFLQRPRGLKVEDIESVNR